MVYPLSANRETMEKLPSLFIRNSAEGFISIHWWLVSLVLQVLQKIYSRGRIRIV